jgi:dihydrofolate reductase
MSSPVRMPSISVVVARSYPHKIIGRDNQLPWHLRTDLQRFKQITIGHVIIMGRNTFLSIGRPLPGRVNIILSRHPANDLQTNIWSRNDTSLLWAHSREDAMYLADIISLANEQTEFFIIGGEQMYSLFEDLINRIHLTQVFTPIRPQQGDARFDFEIDYRKWKTKTEEEIPAGPKDDFPTRYSVLDRRIKTVRYVELESYYTFGPDRKHWISERYQQIGASNSRVINPSREYQLGMFRKEEHDPELSSS